jgi:hypothetical protein
MKTALDCGALLHCRRNETVNHDHHDYLCSITEKQRNTKTKGQLVTTSRLRALVANKRISRITTET